MNRKAHLTIDRNNRHTSAKRKLVEEIEMTTANNTISWSNISRAVPESVSKMSAWKLVRIVQHAMSEGNVISRLLPTTLKLQ